LADGFDETGGLFEGFPVDAVFGGSDEGGVDAAGMGEQVGEEIDVTVSELSRRGDGVARIQGFVIFIPNTKQGMQAKIRIKEIRPNFATAELIESGPSS